MQSNPRQGSFITNLLTDRGSPEKSYPESFILKFVLAVLDRLNPSSWNQTFLRKSAQCVFILILYGCIFMPRISVILPGILYPIDIRLEDVLLPFFVILVLFRSVGSTALSTFPDVENRFLFFIIACGLSIVNGFFLGTIDKPFVSFFCLLKWFEYFLFFAAGTRFFEHNDASFSLKAFFGVGIALGVYGYFEFFFPQSKAVYPNYYRIFERAPFYGDANHVGGLLVLWISFFTGCLLLTTDRIKKIVLSSSILFVLFPLIWTYSRKSYFALAGCYLLSLLWVPNRKRLICIASLLIIGALLLPTRFSERVLDIGESFSSDDPFHTSWAGDLAAWKKSMLNFDQVLVLGSGWGSRHRQFYESQYIQVLSESGVIGFMLFLALLWTLIIKVYRAGSQLLSLEQNGIRVGWLMAFVAFLIHSSTCVSFTVVKLALPFWFLTAFVLTELRRKVNHAF